MQIRVFLETKPLRYFVPSDTLRRLLEWPFPQAPRPRSGAMLVAIKMPACSGKLAKGGACDVIQEVSD
ncbi:hypothetical protein EYF80_048237 [Liparis tanakae]|uniref:Uncharacterized protein n=1 Tax=Liparis tanakae TaxID=230148 RepID=A0A4Z2FLD5_9TELE|nr:hypothetical protein EYF80_048237 [Liparis tanakae]